MGNFYKSFVLSKKLLEEKTYCEGTLNIKQIGNRVDLVRKKDENLSLFIVQICISKWRAKREVLYVTNEF